MIQREKIPAEKVDAFCAELEELCQKHGIYPVAVSDSGVTCAIVLTDDKSDSAITFSPIFDEYHFPNSWQLDNADAEGKACHKTK
jgi:hypothetical protein